MRLIIARSNFFSYSETFIEEQINQLKEQFQNERNQFEKQLALSIFVGF